MAQEGYLSMENLSPPLRELGGTRRGQSELPAIFSNSKLIYAYAKVPYVEVVCLEPHH